MANSNYHVYFKWRVEDVEHIEAQLFNLTDSHGMLVEQTDVLFCTNNGRLKLRMEKPERSRASHSTGELIHYEDHCMDKLDKNNNSAYAVCTLQQVHVEDVCALWRTLSAGLSVDCMVRKLRRRYEARDGQPWRLYLDEVEHLGWFVLVEVSCWM